MSKKNKMLTAIGAIVFATYNIVLFVIAGFTGHTAVFWTSWVFMQCAFAALAITGILLGRRGMALKDWLFGFPIAKHTTLYLICEFIASVIFISLEKITPFALAFSVQLILLCVYSVFAISCFIAKDVIDEVHTKVGDKTRFIHLLRADAEMLAVKCRDESARKKCEELSRAIRFSDPMSNEVLFELEKEIAATVTMCNTAVTEENYEEAVKLCDKAMILLAERNKKTKSLKA